MNKGILLSLVAFSFSFLSFGQVSLFKDKANFNADVQAMMAVTKNEKSIQIGNSLLTVYAQSSETIQAKLFELSQIMYQKKKYKANPHFNEFYSAVVAAVSVKNMPATDLDSMLYVTKLVLDKYDSKQVNSYFTTIKTFFQKDALFASAYNSLYVKGGTFKFRFVEAVAPPEEMPEETKTEEETPKEEDPFSDWDNPTVEEENWSTIEEEPVKEEPVVEEQVLDVGYVAPEQPAIEGAVIVFEGIDLKFESVNETVELKGTKGTLLLKDNTFVGDGGRFDWSVAGYNPGEIFVDLKPYNFHVNATRIYCEGATLTYPEKTDKPVEGIFEYKSQKHKNFEDMVYPRFKSFSSNVLVKGLGDNIEYEGGLSLAGRKIYSSSIDEGTSTIRIKKDGDVIIKAKAPKFELGDSLITTNIATLVLYQDKGADSIYHPGVSIKYDKGTPSIRAEKNSGFKYAPFIDSYHRLDIEVDGLKWNINDPHIDFTIFGAKNQIAAKFESEHYYQADKYSLIQGIYRFHPLQMIIGYSNKHDSVKVFNAEDVAKENKLDVGTVKGSMIHLMKLGFIDYNVKTGVIKLRPKANHYVLARRDKSDYDNIILYSLTPSTVNATLDLANHELTVRGVDKVFLSDSLKVFILPDSQTVKFLANRDFAFNGKINTESFQFIGHDFKFVYDSFLVHLNHIDEIKVAVTETTKDKRGKESDSKSRVLGNELKYSSGTLYINKPGNKSARKKYAEYPIFDATTGATVFFDKPHINGGAYDTTLQFKIPPFRIDSLSSDDKNAIGFDGEFKSGGIFPEFKEKLVVMPDYSLGFVHHVPKDGYQLYENKGKFYNTIKLDNQGLRGDGEIKYLTTTAWSKDFVFYKDSVITIGQKVDTKAGKHAETSSPEVTFPDMQINEYAMLWLPKHDSMNLHNTKDPFHLYKNTAKLEGKSIITAGGMRGEGTLFTRGSESNSHNFHFEETRFSGRNAKFQVLTENPDKPALLCNDVKLNFDLDSAVAFFSPEVEGYASNVFPYLQYKSSLNKGVWDLNKKKIYMRMDEGGHIDKSYFYSTRKDQDSLVYNATEGVYDMDKQTLNINGIPYIKVADAKIFPDSNKVFVRENAEMQTLKNAKIIIDTIYEYHHLYDGTIDIKGRKRFDGVATYQYVNLGSDTLSFKFQDFRLQESIKKKERASTVATGVVTEEDSLYIDQGVIYKGKVTLYADNKILFFDGFVKLDLKGALHYSQWLKYVNNGDQPTVIIDVNDPKTDNGTALFTGLHYNPNDSIRFYTTFISQKKNPNDFDVMTAKGFMNHDPVTGLYSLSTKEKTEKKTLVGNVFEYDDSTSLIAYSGTFNFTALDENYTLKTAGYGNADLNKGNYYFSTLQSITCKGAATPFAAIAKDLKAIASSIVNDTVLTTPEQDDSLQKIQDKFPYKLAELIGDKGVEDYKNKKAAGYVPLPAVSGDLAKAIVFSEVNYKWSHQYNAWYSVGTIKVSNILKTDINEKMDGYIEIRKTQKGDVINIYLQPTESQWYFLSYENNRLSIITYDDVVNAAIAKKTKGELPTRDKFFFVQGDAMEKAGFVRTFEEHYLGKVQETGFDQHEQKTEEVPDEKLEEKKEEDTTNTEEKEKKSPYPYEEKKEYEKKEGTTIEEPELNREKKEQSVEEKGQLKKDQEKMKNLFR
ncbi:MAG: hypothetical protein K2X86_05380 [Cytophagaceae bacterium]|nr:hypothetical protein [Cytophagaceae bacterium]